MTDAVSPAATPPQTFLPSHNRFTAVRHLFRTASSASAGGGVVLDKEGAGPRKGKAYIYMPLLPEEMYINGVHAESDKNKHEKYT